MRHICTKQVITNKESFKLILIKLAFIYLFIKDQNYKRKLLLIQKDIR